MTALFVVVAYLIGSFPTGFLLSRLLTGRDVRQVGSGNIGAANVARLAGLKVGALVALLDIAKGVVPVALASIATIGNAGLALVAVAAVVGHDFSVFLRFKGGKGVATSFGVALILAPLATAIALAIWVAVVALSRYSSLASLLALAWLPIGMVATGRPLTHVLAGLALFLLAALRHWQNIIRLANGTERKLQTRPADGA